jgi:hypothetical protein
VNGHAALTCVKDVAALSYGWLLTISGVDWLVGLAITWGSVVEDSWLSIGAETC